jgi:hypothetical protein
MHIDDEGVIHPLTLVAEVESADVHYASCETCGSRWAGPFKTSAMAAKTVQLANASSRYELPGRVRPVGSGLCHGPDGLLIGTPGAVLADAPVSQTVQLAQAAGDVGKTLLIVGYGVFVVTRAIVLFTIGAVRLVIRLGMWGAVVVGALALAAFLGLRAADPYVPDAATLVPALVVATGALVVLGLVVLLAQGLRGKLAEPRTAPVENITRTNYSTPLTTAGGASSVSPVSKPPAGELPKG